MYRENGEGQKGGCEERVLCLSQVTPKTVGNDSQEKERVLEAIGGVEDDTTCCN